MDKYAHAGRGLSNEGEQILLLPWKSHM